jgi:CheY-like chemotaxis protein
MKKHVLLVDDDEVFHFLNKKIISLSGVDCEVSNAYNGAEAMDLLLDAVNNNATLPDYIFLDLDMPVMDGFEFLELYKGLNSKVHQRAKVVILTSSENFLDRQKARELGVEQFISKPLSQDYIKGLFMEQ